MYVLLPFAIALGAIFAALFLSHILVRGCWIGHRLYDAMLRYLVHPIVVPRLVFMEPWTPLHLILWAIYVAANIVCLTLDSRSVREVEQRAGTLLLINAIPLYFGASFSVIADALGISLATLKSIHRSMAVVVWILGLVRMAITLQLNPSFAIGIAPNLYLIIVRLSPGHKFLELTSKGSLWHGHSRGATPRDQKTFL